MLLFYVKHFWKKRELELVSLPYFLYDFWKKIFTFIYFITWTNFIAWLPLLREILCKICIVILVNLKLTLFLINLFSIIDQKFRSKIEISWERKELLKWNKKHFSAFLRNEVLYLRWNEHQWRSAILKH